MNDKYYEDEPIFKLNPTHIKKQRKPPFVREFEYFSPKLLNKVPVQSDREGYYLYYYMESYYTSHTEKKGDKSVKVYKKHVSKKSLEVTLEQCNALHEGFPTKIWIYTFTPKKALEMEGERLVKRYGIKNSKPDEKFIKTIQNTIYSNCGLH